MRVWPIFVLLLASPVYGQTTYTDCKKVFNEIHCKTSATPGSSSYGESDFWHKYASRSGAELRAALDRALANVASSSPEGGADPARSAPELVAALRQSVSTRVHLYPDFDVVISRHYSPMSYSMAQEMAHGELAADIAYYLALRPDEATRISVLSPERQVLEIQAIRAALSYKLANGVLAPARP